MAVAPHSVAPTVFELGGREPPQSPRRAPAQAPAAAESPRQGNLSLTVSDLAREEDRAAKDAKEKRKGLSESKKIMLSKLTNQIQVCLARVQSGELDENSREKYQDMIMKLKAQMGNITDVK